MKVNMKSHIPKYEAMKLLISAVLVLMIFLNVTPVFSQQEDFQILNKWIRWSDSGSMLINSLNEQARNYYDLRNREIARLRTANDWMKRQDKAKGILLELVGPFPEKTPLNSRITGILQKDGYRVEKIIYESMPKFYVTACLFIPDGIKGKRPVVIYVSGHTVTGFREPSYQIFFLNLVKKGFIVFAIDPISQGERLQTYDEQKKTSIIGAGVDEHSYIGNQCFISGSSLAKYFTWDIVRGVDYLVTRKEVDATNIGIAGRSGGGTQSAYASAFDERIKASAPEAFITSQTRLLESVGAQDAESNVYHSIANGIDHADLIEVRAPRPMMIVTTTRDYFSIQGARETYKEALEVYKAFGKPENLLMAEDDAIHSSTRNNREAVYQFFQRFLELPGNPKEEDVQVLKPEELYMTSSGQVSASFGGESVFSLNKKETTILFDKLESSRTNIEGHLKNVTDRAKTISGYVSPGSGSEAVFCGRYRRGNYCIEMYVIKGEGNCVIPLLLFVPDHRNKSAAVIYLHPEGKDAEASPGGQIDQLVKRGFIVAAPDLIGIGETENKAGRYRIHVVDYATVLLGRSLVGIRAGDVARTADFLKTIANVDSERLGAVGIGEMGPVLLHAAAFDKSIKQIVLLGSPISYKSIVMNPFYKVKFSTVVPGALTSYDLPDLLGCIAPRKVVLAELKDHMLEPASAELIQQELEFPRSVYSIKNLPENMRIVSSQESLASIVEWCFE
jgi:cephalosporin-C deacetylase-like acetyl esterase